MNEVTSDLLRNYYDAVPYPGQAFSVSHPDRLTSVAAVEGFAHAPVTRSRVLEIGCAIGRNLIPMAERLPQSRFLGIDLSPHHIEVAQRDARQLGLTNIEFRVQDLMDFPTNEGEFDFILAHGVYSWVPATVRNRLMQLFGAHLSPNGLGYLCYNTLPGWHIRQLARDLLLYHARSTSEPAVKIAKAKEMVEFVGLVLDGLGNYKAAAVGGMKELTSVPEWNLLHDAYDLVNEPCYFEQFVRHAESHGLQHISTASPRISAFRWLEPKLQQLILSYTSDPVMRDQYVDFLHGRAYRDAVLCRKDSPRDGRPELNRIEPMYVAGDLLEQPAPAPNDPNAIQFFRRGQNIPVTLRGTRMIAAVRRIKEAWPHAVPVSELLQIVGEHRDRMLHNLFMGHHSEMLELWTRPTDFMATVLDHPKVTPLLRTQTTYGEPMPNLRHSNVLLENAREVLPLLDGSRDFDQLCHDLQKLVDAKKIQLNPPDSKEPLNLTEAVRAMIATFHQLSLLSA